LFYGTFRKKKKLELNTKTNLIFSTPGAPRRYYRADGVHYVPKLTVDDLIIE